MVVKQLRGERNHVDDEGRSIHVGTLDNEGEHWVTASEPIALARAPRVVRMEAAGALETLAQTLTERMRHYIASIEKAKKTVKD